jgi:DNA-binding MarR family transcriptional regulator
VIAPSEDRCGKEILFFQIQRAARALARRFDSELRPLSLTNGQFILLVLLNRLEPSGMAELASLLVMDRTTLTAALKTLERRDLVKIVNDPTDHRVRRIRLTRRGGALIMTSSPIWKRTSLEIESRLEGQISISSDRSCRLFVDCFAWDLRAGSAAECPIATTRLRSNHFARTDLC